MSEAITLLCGDYRETMRDVECDALITDCPYSDRTHKGQRNSTDLRTSTIRYDAIDEAWAHEFAGFWAPRTRNWSVIFGDHYSQRWHEDAWAALGWYVFAPVFLKTNPVPRFSGDGPALALEFLMVARRKTFSVKPLGSFPGVHEYTIGHDRCETIAVAGRKPLPLMRELVRTYTVPDGLVADPCMGSGTTAIACAIEGRRCVTSEVVPATFEAARTRIERGNEAVRNPRQEALPL